MDTTLSQLINDLLANRKSKDQFISHYPGPFDPIRTPRELLAKAKDSKDADGVGWAMSLAYRFGIDTSYRELFKQLAFEDWHNSHEDIAFELGQDLKDNENVQAIYHMALKEYPYLAYDKAKALATKCIWSLGNIGSTEAIDMLRCLTLVDDPILKKNAEQQLKRLGLQ
jgi:hypothetical protein